MSPNGWSWVTAGAVVLVVVAYVALILIVGG